ncbi:MAG: hypothetical protein ABIC91_04155 [Nanoarchaeota archaeon]
MALKQDAHTLANMAIDVELQHSENYLRIYELAKNAKHEELYVEAKKQVINSLNYLNQAFNEIQNSDIYNHESTEKVTDQINKLEQSLI